MEQSGGKCAVPIPNGEKGMQNPKEFRKKTVKFQKVRQKGGKHMFLGEFKHNVDTKKRLFIPAKFREELGETFVIVKLLRDKCLRVCSLEEWEKYIAPILAMDRKDGEKILRKLHRQSIQVSSDSQGRVVLSSELVELAGIEKNTVIIGCGHYAEIWAEAEYTKMLDAEDDDDMLNALEGMGL